MTSAISTKSTNSLRNNYSQELEARLALYEHLAQAADDVKLGRVQDMNEAFDDIISEINELDMDIGKLNKNTAFYDGYEGEGGIILSLAKKPTISLHIWDGYFEDIFGRQISSETGWCGFTRDYQESVLTFSDENAIPLKHIEEYILDLKNYRNANFSYPETAECLELLIALFEYAFSCESDVNISIL